MRKTALIASLALAANISTAQTTTINPDSYQSGTITVSGSQVSYKAYEKLYYVSNIEDTATQYLNIYIPDHATSQSPIILKSYSTNNRSAQARKPKEQDITGRALKEGMVVCIVGVRGSNSFQVRDIIQKKKKKSTIIGQEIVYTGKMPAPLLDLKSAVRYLRANSDKITGNSNKIITCGTAQWAALTTMLGTSANHTDFDPLLKEMGACQASDQIFGAICYSPIFIAEDAAGNISQQLSGDPAIQRIISKSANEAMMSGKQIPDSLGAEYFADTFITDDEQEYLIGFDAGTFLNTHANHTTRRAQMPIDSMPEITPNWYIRHGSADYSAKLTYTLMIAQLIEKQGCKVNAAIPWGKGHQGEYDLDEVIAWIKNL